MKFPILLSLWMLLFAACTPAVPVAVATLTPTSVVSTPTIQAPTLAPPSATALPAATNTPAPTAARTPTLLPAPAGVIFKYDDGVSLANRQIIESGAAFAKNHFGDSGPWTVYSYANLDALVEEINRYYGTAPSSAASAEARQRLLSGVTLGDRGVMFQYLQPRLAALSTLEKMRTITHEYFHHRQGDLTNTSPFNYTVPGWLYEGSADYAMDQAFAKQGMIDLARTRREKVQRSFGYTGALSALAIRREAEIEDTQARYNLGWFAIELLAKKYGGDEAVLTKFWQAMPNFPGWPLAFKATFGMTPEEFYPIYEEYRQKEIAPVCGPITGPATLSTLPFSFRFVERRAPGSLPFAAFPNTTAPQNVPYIFCGTGFRYASLTDAQKVAGFKTPPGSAGVITCGGNCLIMYLRPTQAAGTYTFALELPDGRKADASFQHR